MFVLLFSFIAQQSYKLFSNFAIDTYIKLYKKEATVISTWQNGFFITVSFTYNDYSFIIKNLWENS